MKTTLIVRGTHCPACQALIEDVTRQIPGIRSCSVDYLTDRTEVEYEGEPDLALLRKEIESLGNYRLPGGG